MKNIGANATSPLLASNVLYSLVFSVLLLHEVVTFFIAIGTALILAGVLILEIRSSVLKRHGKYRTGYLAAILTAQSRPDYYVVGLFSRKLSHERSRFLPLKLSLAALPSKLLSRKTAKNYARSSIRFFAIRPP